MEYPKVCLRRGEEAGVLKGQRLIYDNELDWADDICTDGCVVDVLDSRQRFAARGFFNSASRLAVRVLTRDEDEPIDRAFFVRRIEAAWRARQALGFSDSCRVVFGESDGLPGLTVDKFADCLSFQIACLGLERWKPELVSILAELFTPRGIYERNDVPVRRLEGMEQTTGLLRGEMSFTGLVTSDCMEMQAVQKFFGSVNGVLAAMNAGVDLVLLSHTTLLSGEAAKAAAEALQSGKLDRKEMEESVDRILAAKAKLAAVPAAAFDAEQAAALNDKLLRATITEVHVPKAGRPNVGGHPLCLGCQVYRTGLVGNVVDDVQQSFPVMMAKALGGDGFTTPIDPSEDEIYEWVRRAESYTSIVIGTYNGHLHPQQLELTKALAEHSGKPVIVVALRNPYDLFPLPESVYPLAAYEYTVRSTAAVADVLLGRHAATGRLPIATPEQEAQ